MPYPDYKFGPFSMILVLVMPSLWPGVDDIIKKEIK